MRFYENGRRILAFGPGYEHLIRTGTKTKTVRLLATQRSYRFHQDQHVTVRCGQTVRHAVIEAAPVMAFGMLTSGQLRGESPDSRSVEALRCVLGNMYRQPVSDAAFVQVIRFRYEGT